MPKSSFELMLEGVTGLPVEFLRRVTVARALGGRSGRLFRVSFRPSPWQSCILTPEQCDREADVARHLPK